MVTDKELKKQGFRLHRSKYKGTCTKCGEQYSKDSMIWWRKDWNEGESHTSIYCSQCVPPKEEGVISVIKKEPVVKKKKKLRQLKL